MTWALSDLLRAIATTIVIAIHASHDWWFGVKDTTSLNPEIFIDTLINQVGRFTVPIFVILSGFAIAKSEEKRPFQLQMFWQRRLWRIVPPYLLFTLLNLIGRSQFVAADWQGRFHQIWQAIATGMGDYHLYFLGIIFQCYVFYPLLRHIRFSLLKLALLILIIFNLFTCRWISATFGIFANIGNLLPDGNHLIYWLPYFQLGIWLATDQGWTEQLVMKLRSQTWAYLFAIAASLELSEFYWTAILKNSAESVGHYTRPSVVLMTLIFLLWSISWRHCQPQHLSHFFQQAKQTIQPHIKVFASASFITYLSHVWVLRLIEPLEIFGGLIFVTLAAIFSWLSGIIIWRLLSKTK